MKIDAIKKKSFAVSIIAFPVMLLAGFVNPEKIINNFICKQPRG